MKKIENLCELSNRDQLHKQNKPAPKKLKIPFWLYAMSNSDSRPRAPALPLAYLHRLLRVRTKLQTTTEHKFFRKIFLCVLSVMALNHFNSEIFLF